MKKFSFAVFAAAALSASAFAANSQTGCGLGGMVIKNPDSALLYALQATTNGISGNQTFGITTGTLDCQQAKLVSNDRAERFVNANADALSADVARGEGEYLDALAELLEVAEPAAFKASLRANYLALYADKNATGAQILDGISAL